MSPVFRDIFGSDSQLSKKKQLPVFRELFHIQCELL